jgi:hypothetical protein
MSERNMQRRSRLDKSIVGWKTNAEQRNDHQETQEAHVTCREHKYPHYYVVGKSFSRVLLLGCSMSSSEN